MGVQGMQRSTEPKRDATQPMIKVGCCGFPVKKQDYYRRFPVVELQQTFYKPPKVETARRWREQAPPSFEFTLKAWQLITHEPSSPTYRRLGKRLAEQARKRSYGSFKPTEEVFEAWEKTAAIARALEATLIIFQSPPSFDPTREHKTNLRSFFSQIERKDFTLGWEPRGEWKPDVVKGLCEELDLIHVVDPLKQEPVYGRIRYFRLHGRTGYRYLHTDEDLERLKAMCPLGVATYVFFNNFFMAEDASRFLDLIQP